MCTAITLLKIHVFMVLETDIIGPMKSVIGTQLMLQNFSLSRFGLS